MNRLAAAALLSFACFACFAGGCANPAAVKDADEAADKVCACKDLLCAKNAVEAFATKHKDATGTSSDKAKIGAATKRIQSCTANIVLAPTPAPTPAPPVTP
ncbi:MAG: hypothetical protein EXR73_09325 [Myxococcales bacterium]|nr:hypothetical protein [Myxococcales bacterium]